VNGGDAASIEGPISKEKDRSSIVVCLIDVKNMNTSVAQIFTEM
jgi:hypothetical protein